MPDPLQVTEVRFLAAPRSQREAGHLGWTTFVINGSLKVGSVSVRRRLDGDLSLSFPVRQSRTGVQHPILAPISEQARSDIEGAVLSALHAEGHL